MRTRSLNTRSQSLMGDLGDQAPDRSPGPTSPLAGTPALNRRGRAVDLDGVSKSFSGRPVLDGLSLHVDPGSFTAVVGRSGGGKSTLLRLIAGLERATAGTVRNGGAPVHGLQPQTRVMFQDARLLPWQRVVGNVGIARGPGWRARALEALAAVGLEDRADDWPSVLSGGQRQRVALARALVGWPGMLLLDEPFSALDALTRVEMHRLLLRLWRERGFTAVLITHDVSEALALADRVVVLREGRIALEAANPKGGVQGSGRGSLSDISLNDTRLHDAILAAV